MDEQTEQSGEMKPQETGTEPVKPPKKRKKWKRVLLVVIFTIVALILGAVAGVGMYMNHLLNQLTPYDTSNDVPLSPSEAEEIELNDPDLMTIDPDSDEEIPDISDMTFPTEPTEPVQPEQPSQPEPSREHIVNILLIGQDRRPGEGRQRSDSMILVTFNKSRNTITLTSFMRDSYVQIPGYKPNKLNAAYAYGGMSLLNETLRVNFGVQVDGNVEVDFDSFREIIDLLDGVDISLTKAEVEYLNRGTGWDLTTGVNRLTGDQALSYSRIRYIDSDYRRAERQRKVLLSLIDRYKSQSITKMLGMLEDILPLVTTNMDKSEIVNYAVELAPMLTAAEFDTLRIPADGTFRQGNVKVREGLANWFQYDIDFSENKRILNKIFAE